jgi:hypothetical protein
MKNLNKKCLTVFMILVLSIGMSLILVPTVVSADINTVVKYFYACPNPYSIFEPVKIRFEIYPNPPSGYLYNGITLTLIKPDGTSEIFGPFSTNSFGKFWLVYTPTMIGTYTLTVSYPGEILGTDYYTPCDAGPIHLVCGTEPTGWSTIEVVSTESTDDSNVPSLAVGSDGTVHIAWQDWSDYGAAGTDSDIFYKKYVVGSGWTTTEVVSTESTEGCGSSSLAVDSDGVVHIAWTDGTDYDGSGSDGDIFYKRWSSDTGWSATEVVSTESTSSSHSPSLAVSSDGTVHIAWEDWTDYDGSGADSDIFYKKYVPGSGWTTTTVVSTATTSYSYNPSLDVGSDGTVHIAWEEPTDYGGSGADQDIFYKKLTVVGWTTTEVVSTESTSFSTAPCLAVGSDGTVHIAWEDMTDYGGCGSDVDVFYKKYVPGSGWTVTEVVSTESTSNCYAPSLAVGPDETAHVTWYDSTDYAGSGNDYDIFYKKYVVGVGWTTTEVVSTVCTGNSYAPSLAVGSDGTVHMAWNDHTDYSGAGTDDDIFYKKKLGAKYYLVVKGLDNRIYYRAGFTDIWQDWKVVPTGCTCDTPAAAVYDEKLFMVVRGMDCSSLFFGWVNLDDDSFSGWNWISGSTSSAPTLTCYSIADDLVLVVRGMDNRIYYRIYDCVLDEWDDWIVIPRGTTCDRPAATVVGDYLHLVVRGMTGHGLYYKTFQVTAPDLLGWDDMSGDTPSTPTLAHTMCGFYLVVRGMEDTIYYNAWSGGWDGWTQIPGAITRAREYGPAATISENKLHLVVISTNTNLYHSNLDLETDVWDDWDYISGITQSAPTLTN